MQILVPQMLIAVAGAFVGRPDEDNSAFGRALRARIGHRDPGPWDAAIVHHWGYWSHADQRTGRSRWPVSAGASAAELGRFGAARDVLRDRPWDGDIFLQYSPVRDAFVRAGIVAAVVKHGRWSTTTSFYDAIVVEGDSNARGEIGGGRIVRAMRRFTPGRGDRFLRWTELRDAKAAIVSVGVGADVGTRRAA